MTPELQRKLEDAAVAAGIQLSLITQAKRYLRQLAPQAAEREGALLICQLVLKLQDAERMAAAVDDMVRRSALDARSLLADARLDYGKPFSQSTVQEILSTRPEALRIEHMPPAKIAVLKLAVESVDKWLQSDEKTTLHRPHVAVLILMANEVLEAAVSPRGTR